MLWHSRAFRHPDYRLQVWMATLQEEASEPRCGFSPDGGEMDACLFQTCIFSLPAPPPGPRWAHRYVGIHNTNRSLWKWSSEFLLVALLHSSYVIGCFYSISIVSLTWHHLWRACRNTELHVCRALTAWRKTSVQNLFFANNSVSEICRAQFVILIF